MSDQQPHRGYHDLGGVLDDLDGGGPQCGTVDRSEHQLAPWEKRVDAMRNLLGDRKRNIMRADVLRNAIETMGEDLYRDLSYYERWMAAIIKVLTERGVLERSDIDARMAEVAARLGVEDRDPRPLPRADA